MAAGRAGARAAAPSAADETGGLWKLALAAAAGAAVAVAVGVAVRRRQRAARLARVLARIDAVNAEDPTLVSDEGLARPAEVVYGERMSACLEAFARRRAVPDEVRIAVRAQHVARFKKPRSTFPEGKVGYLAWRRAMYAFHGEIASQLMLAEGYDAVSAERVRTLLSKDGIKGKDGSRCPDTQLLEDVICLVFLRYYWKPFSARKDVSTDEAKAIGILQKTWAKMSAAGHAAALEIPLPEADKAFIVKALSAPKVLLSTDSSAVEE